MQVLYDVAQLGVHVSNRRFSDRQDASHEDWDTLHCCSQSCFGTLAESAGAFAGAGVTCGGGGGGVVTSETGGAGGGGVVVPEAGGAGGGGVVVPEAGGGVGGFVASEVGGGDAVAFSLSSGTGAGRL